jgi:hypothetical protein
VGMSGEKRKDAPGPEDLIISPKRTKTEEDTEVLSAPSQSIEQPETQVALDHQIDSTENDPVLEESTIRQPSASPTRILTEEEAMYHEMNLNPPLPLSDPTDHKVAILVPLGRFSGKWESICVRFLDHMIPFVEKLGYKEWKMFVCDEIKDSHDMKFNKGFCFNVAFEEAMKDRDWDYLVFNDVDYAPCDDLAYCYKVKPTSLVHIGRRIKKYEFYGRCWGAIFSVLPADFRSMNGFPNNYFGWGGEDNALGIRSSVLKIKYSVPLAGEIIDLEGLDDAQKKTEVEAENAKNSAALEMLEHENTEYLQNGLSNLEYELVFRKSLHANVEFFSFVISSRCSKSQIDELKSQVSAHFENSPLGRYTYHEKTADEDDADCVLISS